MAQTGDTGRSDSFYRAQTTATDTPETLKDWWGADTATFYSPYKVEFIERKTILTDTTPLDVLKFRLVKNESLGPFEVDLKDHTLKAWPFLPSTIPSTEEIQSARENNKRIFGFLFLSDAWHESEHANWESEETPIDLNSFAEGGGKWPIAGFETLKTAEELTFEIMAVVRNPHPIIPLEDSIKQILMDSIRK